MPSSGSDNGRSSEKRALKGSEDTATPDDTAAERIALRKVDWHILPVIFLYYMISFLDRYLVFASLTYSC